MTVARSAVGDATLAGRADPAWAADGDAGDDLALASADFGDRVSLSPSARELLATGACPPAMVLPGLDCVVMRVQAGDRAVVLFDGIYHCAPPLLKAADL